MSKKLNFIIIQGEGSGRQLGCYGIPNAYIPPAAVPL